MPELVRDGLRLMLLITAVLLTVRIFTLPIRILLRFLWNGLAGLILLLVFNAIGQFVGVTLGINAVTCLVTGVLGIPGLVLLLLLRWLTLL